MHSLWQQRHATHSAARRLSRESGEVGSGVGGWGLGSQRAGPLGDLLGAVCFEHDRLKVLAAVQQRVPSIDYLQRFRLPSALVSAQWLLVVRLGPPLGDHPSSGCAAHTACIERGTSCCMLHGAMVRVVMLAYIARMSYVVRCVPHAVPPHAAGREYTIQHTAHAPDCGPQPHGRQSPAACSMLYRLPPIESNP